MRRIGLAIWIAGLAGCPDSHGVGDAGLDAPLAPDVAVATDAPSDVGTDPPERLTFVIAAMDLPALGDGDRLAGANLDGLVSDGAGSECTEALDFVSPITGALGVDNQMGANLVALLQVAVAPEGYPAMYRDRLAAGRDLVVIDLSGIDSMIDDDELEAHVFLARVEGGAPPLLVDGRIAPGQRFTEALDWGTVPASITAGRLALRLDGWALALGPDSTITVRQLQLGADLTPEGLSRGEIGGHVLVAEELELVLRAMDLELEPGTLMALLAPDLSGCEAASIGFTFEAVPAITP